MDQPHDSPDSTALPPAADEPAVLELPVADPAIDQALNAVQRLLDGWLEAVERRRQELDEQEHRLEQWAQEIQARQGQSQPGDRAHSEHHALLEAEAQRPVEESEHKQAELQGPEDNPGERVETAGRELADRQEDLHQQSAAANAGDAKTDADRSPPGARQQATTQERSQPEAPAENQAGQASAPSAVVEPVRPNEEEQPRPAEPDIASMDLDAGTLRKLKVLRRLAGPGKSDLELLARLQAREPQEQHKCKTRKRWWQKGS